MKNSSDRFVTNFWPLPIGSSWWSFNIFLTISFLSCCGIFAISTYSSPLYILPFLFSLAVVFLTHSSPSVFLGEASRDNDSWWWHRGLRGPQGSLRNFRPRDEQQRLQGGRGQSAGPSASSQRAPQLWRGGGTPEPAQRKVSHAEITYAKPAIKMLISLTHPKKCIYIYIDR